MMMELTAPYYWECHITIEPVFDDLLETFKNTCAQFKFKVANLILKRDSTTEEPSKRDSFATAHSSDSRELKLRMEQLVLLLSDIGFKVNRYKIEAVVLDSRHSDHLCVIK